MCAACRMAQEENRPLWVPGMPSPCAACAPLSPTAGMHACAHACAQALLMRFKSHSLATLAGLAALHVLCFALIIWFIHDQRDALDLLDMMRTSQVALNQVLGTSTARCGCFVRVLCVYYGHRAGS